MCVCFVYSYFSTYLLYLLMFSLLLYESFRPVLYQNRPYRPVMFAWLYPIRLSKGRTPDPSTDVLEGYWGHLV